jgi:uncharacterized protein YbjT (DUF2867 family)
MRIFVTGASGFVGRHLVRALAARGHAVTCGLHRGSLPATSMSCTVVQPVDFASELEPGLWAVRFGGVEVLVNAVGVFRERGNQDFDLLHARAPIAMFTGALTAGVRRVVQISALGADSGALSRFHLSKKVADDFLASLPLGWVIVQPSLVFGPGGGSASMFTTLASLPLIPLPGRGDYEVQPIHVDDVVEALVTLVEEPACEGRRIPLVGPEPLRFDAFLAQLRAAMGLGRARFLRIPRWAMRLAASLPRAAFSGMLERETIDMLVRGNVADVVSTRELLDRSPRPVARFFGDQGTAAGRLAQVAWLLPILRGSVSLVWIATGIVSVMFHPRADSFALLARAGIGATWAAPALWGAAALDVALGIAGLWTRRRSWIWLVQIGVILAYTAIITARLPEYWLHPYGPVLKNLPMIAAIWLIYELERKPSNT